MAAGSRNPKRRPEEAAFTVDTQLFRELGELLVGRDATALLELIKNAYDADATTVMVHAEHLASKSGGQITITDDGTGMTLAQFRSGFLRLAGRTKSAGNRRSSRYGRRYTGEKGVGRLAAHKLSSVLEVDSVPWSPSQRRPRAVRARIDWTEVERHRTLENAGGAIQLASYTSVRTRRSGTQISLLRLRHPWGVEESAEFVAGAEAFSPPQALITELPARVPSGNLLFATPRIREQQGEETDPGFRIQLTGDFSFGGEHWDELVESVEWVLEIDASKERIRFSMSPTDRELTKTAGHARQRSFTISHPTPKAGPCFQARIFARARGRGSETFRNWSTRVAGIRVYSEGFRVLPYGESDNDWLEINRDYAARRRQLRLIDENQQLAEELRLSDDDDFALTLLPSDSYVGAVLLTRERSGDLEMLVNREGFVPNGAFDSLKALTRLGIDLLTRARAAGRQAQRDAAKVARETRRRAQPSESDREAERDEPSSPSEEAHESIETARAEIAGLRVSVAAGKAASKADLERLEEEIDQIATTVSGLIAEQRLTPVLASVGIQMAEFVHEINGLLAMAGAVDAVLGRVRDDPDNFASAEIRRSVAEAHQTTRDLRARLERQASYLIDLTSPSAVRRRSRQRLAERVERAADLVLPLVEQRGIAVVNRVSPDIRTPPMFPAELTAVLLNLLTNAVKGAGEKGRILVTARVAGEDRRIRLRIQNTGEAVDLDTAERWFRPFETTTTDVDPLLGQGMGLGLPITRGILEEYGARIAFVSPRKGYATAVQVEFRE
jgi:signal transduction histidine kinase